MCFLGKRVRVLSRIGADCLSGFAFLGFWSGGCLRLMMFRSILLGIETDELDDDFSVETDHERTRYVFFAVITIFVSRLALDDEVYVGCIIPWLYDNRVIFGSFFLFFSWLCVVGFVIQCRRMQNLKFVGDPL